jgi:predicted DNA-binding transcriptional regulator YafY
MRASRLVELLLLLQVRGRASAPQLAAELEVSVRTIYRDVEALNAAGVPLHTETGRHGGIRLLEGYRPGGLPRLAEGEARGLLFGAVPTVARQLGLESDAAARKLLGSLDAPSEAAARSVRERLFIELDDWWRAEDDAPYLLEVARAVWDARELRMRYRSATRTSEQVCSPLGLVLKGATWYLVARPRRGNDRVYRISRIEEATVLEHRFERPASFDLAGTWKERKRAFAESIPSYFVMVRVSPDGERLLHLLQEGTPALPLPPDVQRDEQGWALLRLRFERPDTAGRLLLQLGADIEVTAPVELRDHIAATAADLRRLYNEPHSGQLSGSLKPPGR